MNQTYDCIIVGAGIVGLTTALALAQNNFKIALVETESFKFDYNPEEFSLRVSAINRSSENIFKNLNVWPAIKAERVNSYTHISVWDEKGNGHIEFSAEKIAQANLGYIIENRVIQKNIFTKASIHPNITLFNPVHCLDLYHKEDEITLQLEGNNEIKTKLIIGSDGANSWVRNRAQFELYKKKYNHHAMVTTVKTEMPHDKTTRQRFLSDSILALLPLPEPHTHSIVWSTVPAKAKNLMALTKKEFALALTKACSSILGTIEVLDHPISFPLYIQHVKNYAKPRIVLVGDAAHTIHPLAGQGVNLGLLDAASLVDVLLQTRSAGRDIGLLQNLRKYERARKSDNQLMLLATSGFKNLFAQESTAIVWARNLGLNLTDKAEPVKNLFIKKAMGLIGDIPSLAKLDR